MSLRTHARAVGAAGVISLGLLLPPVAAVADNPSPYGILADSVAQALNSGRFSITATLRGEVHGDGIDVPSGRVSLLVDMVKGRGAFEGNVDLGSIGPAADIARDAHAGADGRVKWEVRWDERGVRAKAKGFDWLVQGAPGFTSATAPDGWMGLNGNQVDQIINALQGIAQPMGIMADLPVDGPWTRAAFNAAGLTADWGPQSIVDARDEYRVIVDLDPAVLQQVIGDLGGPVVLTRGGAKLMTGRQVNEATHDAVDALDHTDQLRLDIHMKKGNRQVSDIAVRFRGTVDGQRANLELKLQFKALPSVGQQVMPSNVENLGPLFDVAMCVLDGGSIDGCAAGA